MGSSARQDRTLGSTSSSVDQEISALHCKIGLKESSARMVPFSLPGFVFP